MRFFCGTVLANRKGSVSIQADFENPAQELFLWSVLMIRQDMAKIFWAEGKVTFFFPSCSYFFSQLSKTVMITITIITIFIINNHLYHLSPKPILGERCPLRKYFWSKGENSYRNGLEFLLGLLPLV